jgi:hypothetical protein
MRAVWYRSAPGNLVQKGLVNGTWFGTEICLVNGTLFGTEACLVNGTWFGYRSVSGKGTFFATSLFMINCVQFVKEVCLQPRSRRWRDENLVVLL